MKQTTDQRLTGSLTVCLTALFCCMLWGSAAPCIKTGYRLFAIDSADTGSLLLFAGMRFTLAGIIAIIIGSLTYKKLLFPKKENWLHILELGMVQTVIQYIFFYVALANTTGVKASIIQGSGVFISLLVASLVFHMEKLTSRKLLGCIIGFAGLVIINLNGGSFDMSFKWNGEGFIICNTTASAFSTVMIKRFSQEELPYTLSGYQFFIGGLILCCIGLIMGGRLSVVTAGGIMILLYLAALSAVAYSLWGVLLKYNPVGKISIFKFATPVFGVILSAFMLGESKDAFGLSGLVSLVLICIGIFIVNSAPKE